MTDEDKKRIYRYCEYNEYGFKGNNSTGYVKFNFDGNDMVAAMNQIVEKGDWKDFDSYSCRVFVNDNSIKFDLSRETWTSWLMQPARFFELMAKWLEEQK